MLEMLNQRSTESEWMDTRVTAYADLDECLRHIEIVNRGSLGYRPVLSWLESLPPVVLSRPLSILDVGCGRGEMLRQIWRWAKRRRISVHLTGIDNNPWAKMSAESAIPAEAGIVYETADIYKLEAGRKFDFIISTHFTHHLKDDEIVRFLRWMEDHALQGWFINDLHRHWAPYLFVKYILSFAPINRMARHDGPVSVARGFTAREWAGFLQRAGIPFAEYRIRWFFPFRYGIARRKTVN